jgi:calcium-dependent protein kinase
VLNGVKYIHSENISHRDLKPDNILFSDGVAKIGDFGLSRYMKNDSRQSLVGTPYYVAPEVINGQYDTECDMWSLGVCLFVVLQGKYPFTGIEMDELFSRIKS